jgi:collagen type I alpha
MSGTQITEIDTPLVGDPGTPASSSNPGTPGGDAPAISEPTGTPFNDQDFSAATILTLDPKVTGGAGGNGAAGVAGTDGTATTVYSQLPDNEGTLTTITYVTPGTGGGDGGGGGAGGDAALAMSGDSVGAIGNSFANSRFILDPEVTGGVGGNGNAGGLGGSGGANINTQNLVESGTSGGDGGSGGKAGNGGTANGEVSGLTSYVQDGTALTVEAIGGGGGLAAGDASISGNEGGNAGDPTGGGNGGQGGNGAGATATLTTTVAADDTQLGVELNVIGGTGAAGGAGGPGGAAGFVTDTIEPFNTYRYGANGNGGNGGNGGDASAILTHNTLTAPTVGIDLFAEGGAGGAGGLGANESSLVSTPSTQYDVSPPGATGVTGSNGTASIVFTDNVVTVGAGVPGDTLANAFQMLTLNLEVATQNSGGTGFVVDQLDGASGGNIVFSGNDFVGAGASTLDLNLAGNGTVTVNTLGNTISIDGSPGNAMTGFNNFDLDNNDTFIVGGQSYVVTYASDPDTLVYTPQSHDVTVQNVTASNLLLDFSGFGATLDAASLPTDITTGDGNTYITIPGAGLIELAGFTGAIPSGDISFATACYRAGTRIATPHGDIPVENLVIGETVQARFAGLAPIRWIGRRHIDCRTHPAPRKVWPVRVRAGAFGMGAPCRDLWLSPDHAVFVDDVLIPIKHLINHTSIEQVPMDDVTYYHVELADHDVLLAERLPAESYLDLGDRANFTNGGGPISLHPDLSVRIWEAMGCAPLIVAGPELNAARRRVSGAAATLERQDARAYAVA